MEKWAAVGDICRVLHNFNGVLQICAAFTNSAVFRLKKTHDKLSKTVSPFLFFESIGKYWNYLTIKKSFKSQTSSL